MSTVSTLARRHPLVVFFVLAYALTWPVIPLVAISPLLGFIGLFGPAIAAIITAAVADGSSGLEDLLGRVVRWRVGVRWYAVALGLPVVLALATAGLHLALGAPTQIRFAAPSLLQPILFVLIVGEELGWRGYALPRLLARRSALAAGLILGLLWGVWHLPTFFVPGPPQLGLPLPAFLLLTLAYSVLFTWVYLHTRGSVLIATLFHGAINLSQGILLAGVEPAREYWLLAAVYTAAAMVLVFALGPGLTRRPGATAEVQLDARSDPGRGTAGSR